ncbi:MAG: phenol hydroxylase subunit [Actinomycetota bacterium]|nr:phenol hydroxylase subunit [Actinomycetota bacterium]
MPEPTGFDVTRRYVRVIEHRADGFVEFRFSIGDPSLFVEMMLGESAFDEFCSLNHVELLDPVVQSEHEDDPDVDHEIDDWDWTMRDAVHRRFR